MQMNIYRYDDESTVTMLLICQLSKLNNRTDLKKKVTRQIDAANS